MQFRFPLRTTFCAALCSVPVAVVACGGRGPLDTDIATYDAPDASGLNPGDDGVEPVVDSGTKPGSTTDAGKGAGKDAGKDSGSTGLPGLPGFPGLPGLTGIDAGPLGACATCAQQTCGTQVDACVSSPTCVQEGLCDLTTCLGGAGTTGGMGTTGAGGALGGLDIACFQKCGSDQTASSELMSALLCVFTSCGTSCLGALTSTGGTGGGLGGFPGLTAPTTK
jgi:hypothetical protein